MTTNFIQFWNGLIFDLKCNCYRKPQLMISATWIKAFVFFWLVHADTAHSRFSYISASSYFQDGTKLYGRCGGFCGKCVPHLTTGLPIQVIWTFRSGKYVPKRKYSPEPANNRCSFLYSSFPAISLSKMSLPFFKVLIGE